MLSQQQLARFEYYPICPPEQFLSKTESLDWTLASWAPPEIWEIIWIFKEALEKEDERLRLIKVETDRINRFEDFEDLDKERFLYNLVKMKKSEIISIIEKYPLARGKTKKYAKNWNKLLLCQRAADVTFAPSKIQESYDLRVKLNAYYFGGFNKYTFETPGDGIIGRWTANQRGGIINMMAHCNNQPYSTTKNLAGLRYCGDLLHSFYNSHWLFPRPTE